MKFTCSIRGSSNDGFDLIATNSGTKEKKCKAALYSHQEGWEHANVGVQRHSEGGFSETIFWRRGRDSRSATQRS